MRTLLPSFIVLSIVSASAVQGAVVLNSDSVSSGGHEVVIGGFGDGTSELTISAWEGGVAASLTTQTIGGRTGIGVSGGGGSDDNNQIEAKSYESVEVSYAGGLVIGAVEIGGLSSSTPETTQILAVLEDGTELTGLLEVTDVNEATWSLDDGTEIPLIIDGPSVTNTGSTVGDGPGSFEVVNPFGDEVVTALEFTSVPDEEIASDFTILAIEALEPEPFVTSAISLLTEDELGGGGGSGGPEVIPNPEPATIAIWAVLAGLGFIAYRRQNR